MRGAEALEILDSKVKVQSDEVSFGRYLFYFGLKTESLPPEIEDSLLAIKRALIILATELSDTSEYNSYKHSLRSIPSISEITISPIEDNSQVHKIDLRNSMTYFKDLKEEGFSYTTKVFDSERDFSLTLLTSNLIYKIIMFRRAAIVRDMPGVMYGLFDKDEVEKCASRSFGWFEIVTSNIE